MKYTFLSSLALLIILSIKIGYGQTHDYPSIRVCGFIEVKGKYPLSSTAKIRLGYKLRREDEWKYKEAAIDRAGNYCINNLPIALFEYKNREKGMIRVIIYRALRERPFIKQGTVGSFDYRKLEMPGQPIAQVNIKVDDFGGDYYPTPTPTPWSTPTTIPSPTLTVTPSPLPTRTVELSPSPTSLPPAKIDEILAKMNLGNIAFVAPDTMTLDKSETVYLKLGIAQTIEELKKEIEEQGLKGEINAVKGVKIDSQMQAILTGGDDFKVTPITPDTLPVSNQVTTEWKWDVKAMRGGSLKLYLILNAIVEYEDGAGKRPVTIKTFDKYYVVAVPWSENAFFKFFGNNWQWLWTTLIVPIVLWFWNQKRKKTRMSGIEAYKAEKKEKTGFVKTESGKKNSTEKS